MNLIYLGFLVIRPMLFYGDPKATSVINIIMLLPAQ